MYPNHPPPPVPGHKSEYDQYPLQDTQFAPQPMDRGDPFADPYPAEHPQAQAAYDHQPLLRDNNMYPPPPQPDPTYMAEQPSPYPQYAPASPNMHYGGAPRRQPRRYKTSKFLVCSFIESSFNNTYYYYSSKGQAASRPFGTGLSSAYAVSASGSNQGHKGVYAYAIYRSHL